MLLLGASSQSQVKDDKTIVLQDAPEVRAEVPLQLRIAFQPPEGRPPEGNEARSGLTQTLQFLERLRVILRTAPIASVALHEWEDLPAWYKLARTLIVIHENEA